MLSVSREDSCQTIQIHHCFNWKISTLYINKVKSCSAHRGVAIYLHENFDYKILPHNNQSNIWDGLFVEVYAKNAIKSNKSKTIPFVTYIDHPKSS